MPGDDWELDDWEDEAFDEDVYDHSQLDLEDTTDAVVDDEALDDPEFDVVASSAGTALGGDDELTEGGLAVAGVPARPAQLGGSGMGWSAWDVGTIFALGGWLADHHAANTAEQVGAVLAAHGSGRGDDARTLGAAQPPPSSGYRYDTAAGSLKVGDPLHQGVLYAELAAAVASGRDLMFQARCPSGSDRELVLVISAVPFSSGPRLWVVAEENPGGFKVTRLIPVFEPEGTIGAGIFATDHPSEAADAAAWACRREGLPLEALVVTERR